MYRRFAASITVLTVTAALIGIRITGRLWPALPGAFSIGAATMTLVSRRYDSSAVWLAGACMLLAAHTSIALLHPTTLSNIDPDTYAVWITQATNSGSLSMVDVLMYRSLPVYILFVASISELTGLPASSALIGVSLALSIVIPLVAAWFAAAIAGCQHTEWPATTAALGSTVLTMTVSNGYIPIPMTLGFVILLVAVIVSGQYFMHHNRAHFFALAVLGVAITLSHKFLFLVLLTVLVAQAIISSLSATQLKLSPLLILGVVLLGIQWTYFTTFGGSAILSLITVLSSQAPQAGVAETVATMASQPALPRKLGIIARRGHAIVLLPLAGLSWLLLAVIAYVHPRRRRLLFVLGTGVGLVAFIPLSVVFPSELRYTRTIPIAEPLFVALIVGAGWIVWQRAQETSKTQAQVILLLLTVLASFALVAQVGSAPISADHPADYRAYLTEDETAAKEWGYQYGSRTISADPFFAHERPTPANHVSSTGRIQEDYSQRYQRILEPYTNRSISENCPEAVLYRDIKVYRSPRAQVLTWDPMITLNREYSRVFDNGKAQQFLHPQCQ